MGLKEDILALDDRPLVEVVVPEWGGRIVHLAPMSGVDRDALELQRVDETKAGRRDNIRAALVARSIVDPATRERVFSDEDVAALGRKNGKALDRLYDEAMRLNGYTATEQKALEKN